MAEYYLDIETNASEPPNPRDRILTIQFQRLRNETGEAERPLTILKCWEASEKGILEEFYSIFRPSQKWSFIPVGCNLTFDLFALCSRWRAIGINVSLENLLYDHPCIDIQPILVMMNKGEFRGTGLARFTGKAHSGLNVRTWYGRKDYEAIEAYVRDEADRFLYFYNALKRKFPEIAEWWFNQIFPNYKARVDSSGEPERLLD